MRYNGDYSELSDDEKQLDVKGGRNNNSSSHNSNNNLSPSPDNSEIDIEMSSLQNTPTRKPISLFALAGMDTPSIKDSFDSSSLDKVLKMPKIEALKSNEIMEKTIDAEDNPENKSSNEPKSKVEKKEEETKKDDEKEDITLVTPGEAPRLENDNGYKENIAYNGIVQRKVQPRDKERQKTKKVDSKHPVSDASNVSLISSPQQPFHVAPSVKSFYECRQSSSDSSLTSQSLHLHSHAEFASEAVSTSPSSIPEELTAYVEGRPMGSSVEQLDDGDCVYGYMEEPRLPYYTFDCMHNVIDGSQERFIGLRRGCARVYQQTVVVLEDVDTPTEAYDIPNCHHSPVKNRGRKTPVCQKNNRNVLKANKKVSKSESRIKLFENPKKEIKLMSPDMSYRQEYECLRTFSPKKESSKKQKKQHKKRVEPKKYVIEEIDEMICDNNPSDNSPIKLSDHELRAPSKCLDTDYEEDETAKINKNFSSNDVGNYEIKSCADALNETGESVVNAIDEKLIEVKQYLQETHRSSTTKVAKREIRRIGQVLDKIKLLTNELKSP